MTSSLFVFSCLFLVAATGPSRSTARSATHRLSSRQSCGWFSQGDCTFSTKLLNCNTNCTCIQEFMDCLLVAVESRICKADAYLWCQAEHYNLAGNCELQCENIYEAQQDVCPFLGDTSFRGEAAKEVELNSCSWYSGFTCCTQEDAQKLVDSNPLNLHDTSSNCRSYLDAVACIPCSPDSWRYYFTQAKYTQGSWSTDSGINICPEWCANMYNACSDAKTSSGMKLEDSVDRKDFCSALSGSSVTCFDGDGYMAGQSTFQASFYLLFAAMLAYIF